MLTNQSLIETMNDIGTAVDMLKGEVAKFDAGNNAAGVRARNTLQKVKISCGEVRAAILDVTKARKPATETGTTLAQTPVASANGKVADAKPATKAPEVAKA